ncbi:NTP transferase domain-containing protein [candidate division NPL-UPA2 bacterium]|nr:NTP transferase domain-containing protein [candidate division NPL-UPA2 bacterium]
MLATVIMAGGRGERFWPRSRRRNPKQLLPIAGARTMIQETVDRIKPLISQENIYIVTGENLVREVKRQLPSVPLKNIIPEPMGRNTAACIGLAAIRIEKQSPEAVMVVLTADHLIKERERFLEIIKGGAELAEASGNLVTLGIKCTRPDTGYGYIKVKSKKSKVKNKKIKIKIKNETIEAYEVEKFVEKPDEETARRFLSSGNYYWNSGMFIWTVSSILEAIREHIPKLSEGLKTIKRSLDTPEEAGVIREVYQNLEPISIDYGVMEKAENVAVVKADITWDDVGSWLAMERIYPKDENGNVILGKFEGMDSTNCIIVSDDHLVAGIGVSDLIVVTTPQATLICPKERAQDVKKMVKKLGASKEKEKYV